MKDQLVHYGYVIADSKEQAESVFAHEGHIPSKRLQIKMFEKEYKIEEEKEAEKEQYVYFEQLWNKLKDWMWQ